MLIKKLWRNLLESARPRNKYTTGRREFLVEEVKYENSIYLFLKSYIREDKIVSRGEMIDLIEACKNMNSSRKVKIINLVRHE